MNKEEIKHFKSLLRQGSLRHMNILLDDKFQKELLTIIKDYEKLQQENEKLKKQYCERTDCGGRIGNSKKVEELQNENQQLKKVIDKAIEYINGNKDKYYQDWGQDDGDNDIYLGEYEIKELLDILKEVE